MLPEKFRRNESGTIGLPIRIVVLSIVGLIGFYAILSAINNAPAPLQPMYAKSNISAFSLSPPDAGLGNGTNLSLLIEVLDSDNRGIKEANVILWSPDKKKAYPGRTDPEGNATIIISNPGLPPGKAEGYIAIKVMRDGYRDFTNDYLVKVIQS
jgi:hypothetical protein